MTKSPVAEHMGTREKALAIVLVISSMLEMMSSLRVTIPLYLYLFLIIMLGSMVITLWFTERKPTLAASITLYVYFGWICFRSFAGFSYFSNINYLTNLIRFVPATILICSIQFLARKKYLTAIIHYWKITLLPCLLIIALLCKSAGVFGFFLCILQIYLIWIRVFNRKTQIIVLFLTFFVLIGSSFIGDPVRASIAKYGFALLLGISCYIRRFITPLLLKIALVICFVAPVYLFYSAATGGYSVFEAQESDNSNNEQFADTRTQLFIESITSAFDHNYILAGRTPARGYDSAFEMNRSGRPERYAEVSMINIFTWYGIIGVILYTILFWQISRLGVFKSRNYYIKILAVYVAFRYTMAWIEDCNRFDSVNISLWIMMSCCYLPSLRRLTNKKFRKAISFMNF